MVLQLGKAGMSVVRDGRTAHRWECWSVLAALGGPGGHRTLLDSET